MFQSAPAKRRISFGKTFKRLTQLVKDPTSIIPPPPPEHLRELLETRKLKAPQLKGNVCHTMKEIMTIFLNNWNASKSELNAAIRTTRESLAKRCQNKDPKTAYRHILTLIEYGFLRAKVHIKGGLQLLLNPDLLVFEGEAMAFAGVVAAVAAAPLQSQAIAEFLRTQFSAEKPRRT